MASVRITAISLALLVPAAARPTPTLHVDPSIDDCSVRFAPELTQSAFRRFAREFGSVSAFKQGAPPATLGRWGASLDVQEIFFHVDEASAAWNDTFTHPAADHWLGSDKSFPMLRLRVGVSDAVEVGAFYTENPNANYGFLGVDVKYAMLEQSAETPVTLAVRGAYTKTLYVADMNMHDVGGDVTVARTFWKVFTPYLGLGADTVLVRETSPAVSLKDEIILVPHGTAGLELRYWHVALGAEAQVAALTSFQARVSAVF